MKYTSKLPGIISAAAIAAAVFTTPVFAMSQLSAIEQNKQIGVGWAEWKPMEYRDITSGELQGVLIALAGEVAKRVGVKAEFVQDGWPTLTAGIAANKFQIAMMGISEGRARIVDFSVPMYHVPFTVVVPTTSTVKKFDDINTTDSSIAVTTGSTTDEVLTDLEKSGKLKAQVVRIKDVGTAILSLTSNKVTAFASSMDALAQIVQQQPSLRAVDGDFGASTFSVAMPKGDAELKSAVDKAVTEMVSDGTVEKLLKQYKVAGTVPGGQ